MKYTQTIKKFTDTEIEDLIIDFAGGTEQYENRTVLYDLVDEFKKRHNLKLEEHIAFFRLRFSGPDMDWHLFYRLVTD